MDLYLGLAFFWCRKRVFWPTIEILYNAVTATILRIQLIHHFPPEYCLKGPMADQTTTQLNLCPNKVHYSPRGLGVGNAVIEHNR